MRVLPIMLIVAGCGSNWDLRKGAQGPPLQCESLLNYYVDEDGDGWGERGDGEDPQPQPLCAPKGTLSATNAMDCDDNDADIGAKVGNCPSEIADGDPEAVVGFVRGESEYLFALPDNEEVRHTDAAMKCTSWAGQPTADAPPGDRGLAVLTDFAEVQDVFNTLDAALEELGVSGTPALFVGMRWDEPTGGWVWDDADRTPPTGDIGFCNNQEPDLMAFAPYLNENDLRDNQPAAFDLLVETSRLALVRNGNSWCLGVPPYDLTAPGGVSPENSPEYANYMCERPAPDPAGYRDVPESPK